MLSLLLDSCFPAGMMALARRWCFAPAPVPPAPA